jgi:DNA ligase-associated metallophosphoesterase
MIATAVHMVGERLMLDPLGGLFWPARGLLAVSDLHFEKGSSHARHGSLLPPWDTHVTIDRLTLLLRRWKPRVVVALGDSFHDPDGAARIPRGERDRLNALTTAHRFVWVLGNHDPHPMNGLKGEFVGEFAFGPVVFRHKAEEWANPGEIVGHHHPKIVIPVRGTHISRQCFISDSNRLMMPALGAYTGGLDVRDRAIAQLFPGGGRVFLLGKQKLFSFWINSGARSTSTPCDDGEV